MSTFCQGTAQGNGSGLGYKADLMAKGEGDIRPFYFCPLPGVPGLKAQ